MRGRPPGLSQDGEGADGVHQALPSGGSLADQARWLAPCPGGQLSQARQRAGHPCTWPSGSPLYHAPMYTPRPPPDDKPIARAQLVPQSSREPTASEPSPSASPNIRHVGKAWINELSL